MKFRVVGLVDKGLGELFRAPSVMNRPVRSFGEPVVFVLQNFGFGFSVLYPILLVEELAVGIYHHTLRYDRILPFLIAVVWYWT